MAKSKAAARWAALALVGSVLTACGAPEVERTPSAAPAAKPAAAVYNFDQATALQRLASATPAAWGAASEPFDHAEGLACVSRPAFEGEFTVCSVPGGNVASVTFRAAGDGSGAALQRADGPAEAFMALFETEPYSATDRTRIIREVRAALATERGPEEARRYVAVDTRWVQVDRSGRSYQMTARPLDEPGA